jgi:hypothetical protein
MSWRKIAYLDEVATLSDVAPSNVKKQTASAGTGTAASRYDHKHDIDTATPANISENQSASEGTSTSLARADHVHGTPADWTPKAHATSHKKNGSDEIKLNEFGDPTGDIQINKQALRNPVIDPETAAPSTPSDGQVYYNTTDDHIYVYVAA